MAGRTELALGLAPADNRTRAVGGAGPVVYVRRRESWASR
ncbi:MAG: hypothetical protein JWQ81_6102 [Amycolatopsis sp.]|jgi:hypothetical protein|nr:hypothetical protein [Amycolatopsis sp.]